jgi:hypothetical protein
LPHRRRPWQSRSIGGLGATYLGSDLPAADIIEMAAVSKSEVVVLGVTLQEDGGTRTLAEVRAIAAGVSPSVELWLGGSAAATIGEALNGRVLTIPDYETLQVQLTRVGGRF